MSASPKGRRPFHRHDIVWYCVFYSVHRTLFVGSTVIRKHLRETRQMKGLDMRISKLAAAVALFSLGAAIPCPAEDTVPPYEPTPDMVEISEEPPHQESQWEKFKAGARQAGSAVAQGTRNTAAKVADGAHRAGDAVAEGSKKAGHAIAEGYEEAKEYVKEKVD